MTMASAPSPEAVIQVLILGAETRILVTESPMAKTRDSWKKCWGFPCVCWGKRGTKAWRDMVLDC